MAFSNTSDSSKLPREGTTQLCPTPYIQNVLTE